MNAALMIAALVSALASTVAAQTKPDFVGRWTIEPDPSALASGSAGRPVSGPATLGSGWGSTITITQDASTLEVRYAFFGPRDMQAPLEFTFALDGSPTNNSVMMGHGIQLQRSRAVWEGEKLALITTSTIPNPSGTGAPLATEIRQLLSLDAPTSLVVESTRAGVLGGSASTTRTVYRKL